MKAVIITIGDEILIGQTVDTNAAWIGEQLNRIGVQVEKNISIRDAHDAIHTAIDEAWEQAPLVIMTGGLGPTGDDITKQSLADYFNTALVFSEKVHQRVQAFLTKRGYSMNSNNKDQAMVPEACTVIDNPLGTAPVMKFEQNGRWLFSLPGVPFEMKEIMHKEILPRVKADFQLQPVKHKTIMTYGMPEAFLAEKLEKWEAGLPAQVSLAYLPSPKGIKIRLSVYENASEFDDKLKQAVSELKAIIPGNVFSDSETELERVLLENLKKYGLRLATAESCTGGRIASVLTSVPGSSDVFNGSIVAYQNAVKSKLLNVPEAVIAEYGAVSEPVVKYMAEGVMKQLNADAAIAVSGIAGPGGGSPDKPVGTTWIAIALKNKVEAQRFRFGSTRDVNILRAAYSGMFLLNSVVRETYEQ
ncbi:MAG TPA: CinA family nicotinamide mononucleotide deamidase-related protein [Bacteroidales bacterium]|nr:CinA family nicotinamide mononucleotide deamidase-related protein [Bacteroidales bacterium]